MNELDAKTKTLNEYKEKIDDLRVRAHPRKMRAMSLAFPSPSTPRRARGG